MALSAQQVRARSGLTAGPSTTWPGQWKTRPGRRSLTPLCATSSSTPFEGKAQEFVDGANKFVRQQELDKKLSSAVEDFKASASRTWRGIDAEYGVSDRMERAGKRLEEKARDVDQTYGVRRRIRNGAEWLSKKWPVWSRQLDEFASKPLGKVVMIVALFVVMGSSWFWRLLNACLLLWWISMPVSLLLINWARQRQQEQMQREAEAAEEEKRRRNPFHDLFSRMEGARSGSAGVRTRAGQRGGTVQSGPVIDAEWQELK